MITDEPENSVRRPGSRTWCVTRRGCSTATWPREERWSPRSSRWSTRRGTALTWVDAGRGLAVVVHADGSADWLAAGDLPMGALADAGWTQHTSPLAPGDLLVVCSDGLLDLFGGTATALEDIVRFARAVPEPAELVRQVRELTSLGFAGDDVTVLAVRRTAA